MKVTQKSLDAFIKYVNYRAKYGQCGASIPKPQLKILDRCGYVVAGYFCSVESITDKGYEYINSVFGGAI